MMVGGDGGGWGVMVGGNVVVETGRHLCQV